MMRQTGRATIHEDIIALTRRVVRDTGSELFQYVPSPEIDVLPSTCTAKINAARSQARHGHAARRR